MKPTGASNWRASAALLAAAATLAACGGHPRQAVAPSPTAAPPSSTTPATPTTTPATTAPLTGLAEGGTALLTQPAVVVKIDNIDAARPQTGVGQADIVYEEMVEGGLTRLAAVFQSHYPASIGPIRSGRTTDAAIVDDLNHPVFAYAGANARFLAILRAQPVTDVDIDNDPGAFVRSDLAPAPHNLYSDVANLAAMSTTHAPPPPLFTYRDPGAPFGGAGVAPATAIAINFPAASIGWAYDPSTGQWLRSQNGTADRSRAGTQFSAANVVVQFVPYTADGIADEPGLAPTVIPEGQLVGSGQAWVLSAGDIVKGTWSRQDLTTITSWTDSAGAPILLAPGRTWVELVPVGSVPSVTP